MQAPNWCQWQGNKDGVGRAASSDPVSGTAFQPGTCAGWARKGHSVAISHISSVHEMHPLSGNAGSSFLGREMTKSPSDATTPSERADLTQGLFS